MSSPAAEGSSGDEGSLVLLQEAIQRFDKGEKLPPPKTWDEYAAGVVVWVNRHWHNETGQYQCSVCGGNAWEYGQVVALVSDGRWPAPPNIGHGSFPCVQIECKECGQVQLLDALKLFEPQQPWSP